MSEQLDLTKDLRILARYISGKRYRHTLGVIAMCRTLLARFGGREDVVLRAAVYHDILKGASLEQLLRLAEDCGVMLDAYAKKSTELAHGPVAAGWLKKQGLLQDPASLNAVRYHTTGRAGMTLEEKILYLADAIEEHRSYPEVDSLRSVAETSLEGAMLLSVDQTIRFVSQKGHDLHPDSIALRNELARALNKFDCEVGNGRH